MQTVNVYRCDFCGYHSTNIDAVKECEKSHIDLKEAYIVSTKYKQSQTVPHTIVIRSGDVELTYYNTAYLFNGEGKDA